ncbi:hypothetical protein [Pseudomonas aeruginosa]|uniref:hypothetical protein n=1 Tax=Pseudomonas aeruginosa TaxID=287 RepID=UPI003D339B09
MLLYGEENLLAAAMPGETVQVLRRRLPGHLADCGAGAALTSTEQAQPAAQGQAQNREGCAGGRAGVEHLILVIKR